MLNEQTFHEKTFNNQRMAVSQRQSIQWRTQLVPLALLLVVGLLLYFHWDLSRKVASLEEDLGKVRQERDEVAAKANHLENEIKGVMWEKQGWIAQKKAQSNQLGKAHNELVGDPPRVLLLMRIQHHLLIASQGLDVDEVRKGQAESRKGFASKAT